MMDTVFFYVFAALTLGGGILCITRRNAIHSAISLMVSLLGVAGLYLLQHAEFLFAVQIILYIGGIMLLFLFVIMLVNLDDEARHRQFNKQWPLALAGVAAGGGSFVFFLRKAGPLAVIVPRAVTAPAIGNTEALADVLFHDYLLPFEIASVLLLVAVVGSVMMAKKRI
jgi:NADH-quinone oxidoreductase subunit J